MNSFETGAEPQRLTFDGQRKLAPTFTAAGQDVVFAVHESPTLVAIQRLRLADNSKERLHPTVADHQFDPAFSRDGRYHAFSKSATSPQLVLVIQDTKDKTEATFRPRDARATARSASFAPDGGCVVFSLSDVGGCQIASVNVQGQDLKKLAESPGLNCWPSVSPDGRSIAFGSSRQGDFQIYVMSSDGADVRQLTRGPGMNLRPAWSPDGRRLAFTSNRDSKYELYVMNPQGSEQRRLTHHPDKNDYAVWHPDGQRLLFVSERHGKCDLYWLEVPG